MKILSWNVNGIRSVFKTTFRDWLKAEDPDIVCIQETKCDYLELDVDHKELDGYFAYFNSSTLRKGHSGVAVFTKIKPLKVETELGIERFDQEGRCLKLTFNDFILFNFYIPNGGNDKRDIPYKLEVYKKLFPVLAAVAHKEVILTGDFNIAHTELDVYDAYGKDSQTLFTPIEREQITTLLKQGYLDIFRYKYPEKKSYTWWAYGEGIRESNIGWRIDYFFASSSLKDKVTDAFMQREVLGSDHGPLGIILDKKVEIIERPVYVKEEPLTLF